MTVTSTCMFVSDQRMSVWRSTNCCLPLWCVIKTSSNRR